MSDTTEIKIGTLVIDEPTVINPAPVSGVIEIENGRLLLRGDDGSKWALNLRTGTWRLVGARP